MPPVYKQGFAIQKAQSRELSELRKSIKFHLYIEQSIKHQLTQPSYPNTIAIAIRITGSGTDINIFATKFFPKTNIVDFNDIELKTTMEQSVFNISTII